MLPDQSWTVWLAVNLELCSLKLAAHSVKWAAVSSRVPLTKSPSEGELEPCPRWIIPFRTAPVLRSICSLQFAQSILATTLLEIFDGPQRR